MSMNSFVSFIPHRDLRVATQKPGYREETMSIKIPPGTFNLLPSALQLPVLQSEHKPFWYGSLLKLYY
jgi:hypothetical protein